MNNWYWLNILLVGEHFSIVSTVFMSTCLSQSFLPTFNSRALHVVHERWWDERA